MSAKQLVADYYKNQAFRTKETMEKYLHDKLLVKWHSSKGYLELEKDDILALAVELDKSYSASRVDVTHIFGEDNMITVRYTHFVNAIENPNEEMILAHFVVIWEVKDNKFYKGYLMSQLG